MANFGEKEVSMGLPHAKETV